MKRMHKSFAKGAAILGGMGLIAKIIGAVYTIATTYIIGTHGMSYYTTAFPVYTFLLAISSAAAKRPWRLMLSAIKASR